MELGTADSRAKPPRDNRSEIKMSKSHHGEKCSWTNKAEALTSLTLTFSERGKIGLNQGFCL